MRKARRLAGYVLLQCNADKAHQWQEEYSVGADDNGNPIVDQLNIFLKRRKLQCPKCKCISFKIIKIIISTVHP
ncbi:MAG: hypothetical protein V1661_00555 [bacterium]